jgi:hypothetical protein
VSGVVVRDVADFWSRVEQLSAVVRTQTNDDRIGFGFVTAGLPSDEFSASL